MPNTSYPKGMEKILSGQINLSASAIKAALLTDAYTYSTSHEFLSQCGARVGVDQALNNVSVNGGVFDADDLDFGALPPGNNLKAVVIYKDTGNPTTSPVLFHFDTVTGLPMATNGGGVTVPWDNGVKKIARMGLPFYPIAAQKAMSGEVNFLTSTIKVALLPTGYTYDPAHEFLGDVGTLIGTSVEITNKSVAGGVFDGDDADFGVLAAGPSIGSAVLFVDTGDEATSSLLLHIPTASITGLPLPTNGGGVSLQWSGGSLKIFSLIPA